MTTHKIHAMPEGDGTARLHTSLGYQSVVRMQTTQHERDQYTPHAWIACHADGANPWRAAVEAELEA
jgi:hypothetical protein